MSSRSTTRASSPNATPFEPLACLALRCPPRLFLAPCTAPVTSRLGTFSARSGLLAQRSWFYSGFDSCLSKSSHSVLFGPRPTRCAKKLGHCASCCVGGAGFVKEVSYGTAIGCALVEAFYATACGKPFWRLATADVPTEILGPHLAARIVPATKPNGRVRPSAIGQVIRRLICKGTAKLLTKMVRSMTSPHQFAVGMKQGPELLHEIVSAHIAETPTWPASMCKMPTAQSNGRPPKAKLKH